MQTASTARLSHCGAFGGACYLYDMARSPKTPLWMYAVAVAIGFAIGIAVSFWLVRSTSLL